MRGFSVLLLLLTGTVFVTSPASLLARLTQGGLSVTFWVVVILVYYVLATLLPIDKVIGKLYPVFGVVLMVMAFGILGGIIFGGYQLPEISLANLHPEGLPIWPFMFVTVACGAISGFHATQAPMMSKCITSEKVGRRVFYGAMLKESMIALVWAAGGVAFYGATGGLQAALSSMGQSGTVYDIATGMLGTAGVRNHRPGPETDPEPPGHYAAPPGHRGCADADRFQYPVALFLLEQPDAGDDHPVDGFGVPDEVERKRLDQPDQRHTGHLYVRGDHDLYPGGERRTGTPESRCLPGRDDFRRGVLRLLPDAASPDRPGPGNRTPAPLPFPPAPPFMTPRGRSSRRPAFRSVCQLILCL